MTKPLQPSSFDTLVVIRFYNKSLQQHHYWVCEYGIFEHKLEGLRADKNISEITVQNATVYRESDILQGANDNARTDSDPILEP